MPTIFSHAAVPLVLSLAMGRARVPPVVIAAGVIAAVFPDADVVSFLFGIPYADEFGHRGASHSLVAAALLAIGGAGCLRARGAPYWATTAFLFVAASSHGILDALTNGGEGVALLWPLSDERIFASWRPIEVSPIGVQFFSRSGLRVLVSELLYVWAPLLFVAVAARLFVPRPQVSA